MSNLKMMEWVLRVAVAGEFIGHGAFALQGKIQWLGWIRQMLGVDVPMATALLTTLGFVDIMIALIILLRPTRIVILWAAVWGFWTALIRPIVGEAFWDFIERWANWGAPLALFLIYGWPKKPSEWFRVAK